MGILGPFLHGGGMSASSLTIPHQEPESYIYLYNVWWYNKHLTHEVSSFCILFRESVSLHSKLSPLPPSVEFNSSQITPPGFTLSSLWKTILLIGYKTFLSIYYIPWDLLFTVLSYNYFIPILLTHKLLLLIFSIFLTSTIQKHRNALIDSILPSN